jgi:hypothetical protein
MNLLHKLALVTLLATASCLSAYSDDNRARDFVNTFTLSAFANTSNQDAIVAELLQNSGLSDEKIAQMLEVPVTEVTRARTYFGPLEVKHLAELAATGYKKRCYKHIFWHVCITSAALVALSIPITLGWPFWIVERDHNQMKNCLAIYEARLAKPKKQSCQPTDSSAMGVC